MRFVSGAIVTLVFIFLPPGLTFAQNRIDIFDGDVRVIESDETGITFTYRAPKAELYTPDGYPDMYKAPSIPRTAQVAEPGVPLLPVKLVPIGVPFNSNPRLTIISQSFTPIAQVEVPNFISEKSEGQFLSKIQTQTTLKNWPQEIAYIENKVIIRGLKVLKVALAAAKLEGGMLYQANTITVRVDFNAEAVDRRYSPRPNGRVFNKVLSRIVANYNIAQNWRIDWPPIPLRTASTESAFDSSQVWVRLEVLNSGVYKINRFELSNAGLNLDNIDPREFRIFYGGGQELPIDNDIPRPELVEIPIQVVGEGDGSFDGGDLIRFYAESIDRPVYSEDDNRIVFLHNHYTANNVYWLTHGGDFGSPPKRWQNIDGSLDSPYAIETNTFTGFAHEEQDLDFYINPVTDDPENNFDWYAGSRNNFSYTIQLHNVVSGSEALIVVRSKGSFDSLHVNNELATFDSYNSGITQYYSTALRGGTGFNTFYLQNNGNFTLDYIDVHYQRWLTAVNGQLDFYGPETIGTIEYILTEVPQDYILLEVSSSTNVGQVINADLNGSELRFQHHSDGRRQYYLTTPASARNVIDLELYDFQDLRSASNEAHYIIITHELFYDQALELKEHRENMMPGLAVKVAKIGDIYNQFSWGLIDPTAIRDFLKYAYENYAGTPPDCVVLIGDGHFDYRNNWNNNMPSFIPPFHSVNSSSNRDPFGSDENYIYFGEYGYLDGDSSGSLDMIIGRIAVNNTEQMEIVLDKTINYEANPEMGKWRNNVVIVADDHLTPPWSSETIHTIQGEDLARNHVPTEMEVQKIFLVDYPLRTGNIKPDAREALINAFNKGGLIVDWIGHGNKGLWAHEQLFRRIEDMPRLVNDYRLPLVFTASCSIGYFDHPTEQGMAEDFVRHPGGGGIASIGATRVVYSSGNAELNRDMYDQLLFADSISFGSALYMAKFLREIPSVPPSDNRRKFMIFGDPALIAGKPTLEVEFNYGPDSLRGLTVDSIAGYVTNDSGVVQTNFNGTVWVLVKDAALDYRNYLTDYNGNPTGGYVDYIKPGPTIFYGPAEVANGHFSSSFFIPKDITYGGSGAKIFVYFENGLTDGHGVMDSLPMSGSVVIEEDTLGPTITVSYNGNQISESIQALPHNALLDVRLFDEHGINITGSMGHGLVVEIDGGDTYSADITENFVFDMGDWQQGAVSFRMPTLDESEHHLSIKAWDNYNNSSVFATYITVFSDNKFSISEVMNYPNPVVKVDSTVFQYMLTNDAERVILKIFTLAGRTIKYFAFDTSDYTSSGYHYIPYKLRDYDGDRLASGVYIYKIEAVGTGFDGERRKSEFTSKLAILR